MDVLIVTTVVVLLACAAFVALVVPALKRQAPSKTRPKTPPAPEPGTIAAPAPAEVVVPPTEAPVEEPVEERAAPALDVPEPTAGRLTRLRSRLARSQSSLGKGLLTLLSRDVLDESTWEEIEETLLGADLGVGPTQELVERLRTQVRVQGSRTPDEVRALLRSELLTLIGEDTDRSLHAIRCPDERPSVTLVVGVNGTGKTTTTGKLARVLVADGRTVLLGAADTFRAAAADQLQTWGDRVGARTVRGPEGGDPASVAFEAVKQAAGDDVDAVLIDTAGRLHTKTGLMDELGKVKRVVEKQSPVHEVLLVLDATTGQNGLTQARVFAEVVAVTGIVLSKLDGTAKGGIVIAVQRELGVPVKLIGLGEGADDLAPFDPAAFVDALLEG
ncbi:signal recognition particle-docking protein FtsY [Sporichthya sp.]|uniref:signal recognition particle-docking protein FtsY n=1 Tax=Sporichthya sp. TaxID=65475 RepID=UPI00182AA6DB|nr:signal recognition particle-docking protein FtsY [Sporichthya sp.]MBA3745009.1 signal recognition particle-docking protein FtsY [Sporichthya sp.]